MLVGWVWVGTWSEKLDKYKPEFLICTGVGHRQSSNPNPRRRYDEKEILFEPIWDILDCGFEEDEEEKRKERI